MGPHSRDARWSGQVALGLAAVKPRNHTPPGARLTRPLYEGVATPRNSGLEALRYQALAELLSGCNPAPAYWVESKVRCPISFPFHHPRGAGFSISRRTKKTGAKGPRSTVAGMPRWPAFASSPSMRSAVPPSHPPGRTVKSSAVVAIGVGRHASLLSALPGWPRAFLQ